MIESLPIAAIYILSALSFGLVWSTTREGLFHLALGGIFICSAGLFNRVFYLNFPLWFSIVITLFFSAILSLLIEIFIYRYLRRNNAPSELYLLASFGVLIVLERSTLLLIGVMPLSLPAHRLIGVGLPSLDSYMTPVQLFSIVCSLLVATTALVISSTKPGQQLAALRQSLLLYDWRVGSSSACLAIIAIFSGAISGLAAVLFHLQHSVDIEQAAMGFLIPGFIAVITAETLNKWIPNRKASGQWANYLERTSLTALYILIAIGISMIEHIVAIELEPTWKDSILLIMAIISLIVGRRNRTSKNQDTGI